jgi:SNF2 family DNA or RNA helicase
MEPSCQNVFCGKCLLEWGKTKQTCPLCREVIKINELIYIQNDENKDEIKQTENKIKTKLETVINLIKNKPKGKFIIFSAWDQTFTPITHRLDQNNINYIEIKGATNTRIKNIEQFKNGDVNVIFLNSKFNGSGINLQEATDILIYHEMDPLTLSQVIGRANRIGRTIPLDVHHLQI